MATNVTSLIETKVQTKIKISSGKVGLKLSPQATTMWQPRKDAGGSLERKGAPNSGATTPD